MDKNQASQMRWILFWVFVLLFVGMVVATSLVVFFDIGNPTDLERKVLFNVFIGEVGMSIIALFASLFSLRNRQVDKTSLARPFPVRQTANDSKAYTDMLDSELAQRVQSAGLTCIIPSRDYYAKYRRHAPTIDAYVNTAQKTAVIIGVNLMTGMPFDGLCNLIQTRLESKHSALTVTISLLNPWRPELMAAMAPVFSKESSELAQSIVTTLSDMWRLREKLSVDGRNRLTLNVHNVVPFASAILLDHEHTCGRIQIETKPYKAPIRSSFAFEFCPTGGDGIFQTLCDSYIAIVRDGDRIYKPPTVTME